jgi:ABC-type ATPase with predicted acetyltransferase domain
MIGALNDLITHLDSRHDMATAILGEWLIDFNATKTDYDNLISELGGDKRRQEQERQRLENEKAELTKTTQQFRELADSLGEAQQARDYLLTELEELYKEYFEIRRAKFDELSASSEGKLKLLLDHAQNREKYGAQLVELLKGGTNALPPVQRKQIAEKILPRRFVDLILSRDVETLSKESELTLTLAQKVIEKLWSHDNFAEVLALQHDCYPQDIPKIQFCKAPGHYAELNELSVGQKCTALLIIALAEGNVPVIIDQPEDALDIVSIWEDIAKKLLGRKHSRQFILTTHNSSVAVAADSDQFIIMQAGATEGTIMAKGAIDRDEVKKAVLSHLEGGREPYNLRRRKYNQDDPY